MRIFEGYEAEGRFRGVKTLFVSGKVPFEKIKEFNLPLYGQVYFGADGCTEIDWKAVGKCIQILPIVTVELCESNLPSSNVILFHTYIHPIVNIGKFTPHGLQQLLENVHNETMQLKFSTETRNYLAPVKSFLSNWKSDIQKDKELWRQE